MIPPKPINILHTDIHPISFQELKGYIRSCMRDKYQVILYPINFHIIAELYRNRFKLRKSNRNLNFCDGMPLIWISKILKKPIPERISGTDLTEYLLTGDNPIFLLGTTNSILVKICTIFKTYRHGGAICGYYSPPIHDIWSKSENINIVDRINKSKAKILLIAAGSLKTEFWINEHIQKLNPVLIISVGSALDILSGKYLRAPVFMQKMALEWLWRIMLSPRRLIVRYIRDMFFIAKMVLNN